MKELKALISVKKIIALLITITLIALAFKGTITAEMFLPLATMVVGFYFGNSSAKDLIK